MAPADGADGHPEADATHLDIVRAIGRLEGMTEENFKTLFNVQRDQAGIMREQAAEQAKMNARLAKLEDRRRVRLAPRKRLTWKTWSAVAVAAVTILGGLSSAYHELVGVAVALHHFLMSPSGK